MRVPQHIVDSRRERLRQLIRTNGFLPVGRICERLGVSIATARRDLAAVAANGHVTRTHGGALADYNASFASHGQRMARARTAKGRIAVAAARLVPASGTVFLDAGTTIQAVARRLLARRTLDGLEIVTNSLATATILGGAKGLQLHVLGGMFLHRQSALLGSDTIRELKDWHFDVALLGAEAMNRTGISNSHAEIALVQRAVCRRSAQKCFCLDGTKLDHATPHPVVAWDEIDFLVTDASPTMLEKAGICLPEGTYVRAA